MALRVLELFPIEILLCIFLRLYSEINFWFLILILILVNYHFFSFSLVVRFVCIICSNQIITKHPTVLMFTKHRNEHKCKLYSWKTQNLLCLYLSCSWNRCRRARAPHTCLMTPRMAGFWVIKQEQLMSAPHRVSAGRMIYVPTGRLKLRKLCWLI